MILLYARPRRQKDSLVSNEFDVLRVGSCVLATEVHATLLLVTLTFAALAEPLLWSHISGLHHLIVTAVNFQLSDLALGLLRDCFRQTALPLR